jgi:hypothetical protein
MQLTVGMMFDRMRRALGVTPLVDVTGKPTDVGLPTTAQPWPSNALLFDTINRATEEINVTCELRANLELNVPVPAVAIPNNGPQYIDVSGITGSTFDVNMVRRVVWNNGGLGFYTPIQYWTRDQFDREAYLYDNQQPGLPSYMWMEGYQIALLPASNIGGILTVVAGVAYPTFFCLSDFPDQVPREHAGKSWVYWCVADIAGTQPQNPEMAARVQLYAPRAANAIQELKGWAGGKQNKEMQPSMSFGYSGGMYRIGTALRIRR